MAKHKHIKQDTGFEDGFKIGMYFGAYNPELAKEMIDEYRAKLRSEHNRDYKPVVHGHWIPHYDDGGDEYGADCSVCGVWSVLLDGEDNFCPNCGAYMREVDE